MCALSRRASQIQIAPFQVMEILERARQMEAQGRSVIHMEVGEPDFDTPSVITQTAIEAISSGKTRYTSSRGILPLREAIAQKYHTDYGVSISPDQVIITSGSSAAMMLLFAMSLDQGDEVILTDPGYACYPNFLSLYGAVARHIPLREENQFRVSPEDIKNAITPRTKAIILCSPSNPTGQLVPDEVWEYVAEKNLIVFSDEIYHGLVYKKQARSVLEFTNDAFVISGFSKLYAMTGWRLGYLIAPPEWIRLLHKGHQNFFIAANTFVQWGGLAALTKAQDDVAQMVTMFEQRRGVLIDELTRHGMPPAYTPDGAFYLLKNFSHLALDSLKLAFDILEKTGVALTPGIDFGETTKSYLRFSYATSCENIKEAVSRLAQYCRDNH